MCTLLTAFLHASLPMARAAGHCRYVDEGKVPALVCLQTERAAAWARRALQRHLSGLWAGRLAAHRTALLAGQLAAHFPHACHLGPARHPVMCWSPAPGSCQCPHCPWPGCSCSNTVHQKVATKSWQHACHILASCDVGPRGKKRRAGQLQLSVHILALAGMLLQQNLCQPNECLWSASNRYQACV